MTCSSMSILLSHFLDREVALSERMEVRAHLAGCEDCRATLNQWEIQGKILRGYFGRHALDESFVQKIREKTQARTSPPNLLAKKTWLAGNSYTLLKTAAAILIAFLLLSLSIAPGDRDNVARVVDPGHGLQLWSPGSIDWIPTAAGMVLRPGDWVRNPEQSTAEIIFRNTAQLTLEQGTLAQFNASQHGSSDSVVLLRGALYATDKEGVRNLQIQTPVGSIHDLRGSFGLHVDSLVLPNLQLANDTSESISGSVLALSQVQVSDGRIGIEAQGQDRLVTAGNAAFFTVDKFMLVNSSSTQDGIQASLKTASALAAGNAMLASSLISTSSGLRVRVDAKDLPLSQLLEWTSGASLVGGENIQVSGNVIYPVTEKQGTLVSAVGNSLGITMAMRQTPVLQKTAFLPEKTSLASIPGQPQGKFSVQRSSDGLLSFKFAEMSAGQVFQVLRSAKADLPTLSETSSWIPLTLEASNLKPEEISQWFQKQVGMTIREVNQDMRVVEIGSTSNLQAQADLLNDMSKRLQASSQIEAGGDAVSFQADASSKTSATQIPGDKSRLQSSPALWPISGLAGRLGNVSGLGAGALAQSSTSTGIGNGQGVATPKDSAGGNLALQLKGSRHFLWPALAGATPAAMNESYLLYNNNVITVRTLWIGYDESGRQLAQFDAAIAPSGSLAVRPFIDMPIQLGEGGHWETLSSEPLINFKRSAAGIGAGEGVKLDDQTLPATRLFNSSELLGAESHLWMVNPTDEMASIAVVIALDNRTIYSQQFFLAPHAGAIWSLANLLANNASLFNSLSGSEVLIQALRNSVAIGLSPGTNVNANQQLNGMRVEVVQ